MSGRLQTHTLARGDLTVLRGAAGGGIERLPGGGGAIVSRLGRVEAVVPGMMTSLETCSRNDMINQHSSALNLLFALKLGH